MTTLNLSWRAALERIPLEGKKFLFSTLFLWALRNQQVLDHENWRPEGNPFYPYGTTSKEVWEDVVVVTKATKNELQIKLTDDTIISLNISPSGQISEPGCLNGIYPLSGEKVE